VLARRRSLTRKCGTFPRMGRTTFDFSGQVAVVTGGASGIGKGSAKEFAAAGARVYVVDLDEAAGTVVARDIQQSGGQASFLACDVTDSGRVTATFDQIIAEAGRLDVLVNCAGGFWKQLSVEETSEDEWDKGIDLNLKSIFLCSRAAIPAFKRQASGRIINLGSLAGVSALARSSPPYSAAKAGVHSLTRVLAFELGQHGVTANAIAPSTTATERTVAVRSQQQRDMIGRSTAIGRIGEVSDVVGWVPFLASPEAGYLTGQTLSVNGGRLMV
jgi:3-oxoacyl-[acyl-carrier protein] reductase